LFFDPLEQEAAELIEQACDQSVRLIQESWGLEVPGDCRVYVMTSWLHFAFHAPPWPWKVLSAITLPLWGFRTRRMWKYAGGWVQRYGERRAVGIKPPRLVEAGDWSLGERIFEHVEDINQKVRQVTCHELVHAFTAHLRLPVWLYEGLAMVTVDRLAGKTTVRTETLGMLERSLGLDRKKQRRLDAEALLEEYVRGYWLTRYVAETQSHLLKGLLRERHKHPELERELARAYRLEAEKLWHLEAEVVAHFMHCPMRSGGA
jgi:hypothetical protein